jgi:hypothetical protein
MTIVATTGGNVPKVPCKWTVTEKSRNVHELKLDKSLASGKEAWVLWMSDEHWDHPKCDLNLLREHHKEAQARGAAIIKVGDTFCVMQGRGDPRGDKGSIREEHWGGNYLDLVVKTAADWYAPYSKNIAIVGVGNHDSKIYKNYETDIIDRLCHSLRDKGGITRKGGYSGWVRMRVSWNNTKHNSFVAYYHHGFGGGGQVGKGMPDFSKMAEWIDADAIISGHVHWKTMATILRQRMNDAGNITEDHVHFVRCGTYKNEFEDGYAGWHIEGGRGPRPLGGWWQRLYVKNDKIAADWIEAK